MDLLRNLLDLFLHLDQHLSRIIADYGVWTHLILFLIVFCETGLVITPFLPGDSLLFAAGALAATAALDVNVLMAILTVAAILGDTVNYWVGAWVGTKLFDGRIKWLKKSYLDRTHEFYEKYGAKTIVIARFVPIVRTVAPFVAGAGQMTYPRFLMYNIIGGVVWIVGLLQVGYWFGNLPIVRDHFGLVVIGIILLSIMPAIVEVVRARMQSRGRTAATPLSENPPAR